MRHIINEYGLVAIAVLATLAFMYLWSYMVYGANSFTVIYKTDSIYQNDLLKDDISSVTFLANSDGINAVSNVRDGATKPYFNLVSSTNGVYMIEPTSNATQSFTYSECLDIFSAGILKANIHDGGSYNLYDLWNSNKVEIVITELKPKAYTSNTSGDTIYITEMQDVYDKYGNRVFDSLGNVVQSQQIVYDTKVYARSSDADVDLRYNNFVINNDVPCKYKVIYRITDDTLKAEYTAVFVNKIRDSGAVEDDVYKEWFPEVNFGVEN